MNPEDKCTNDPLTTQTHYFRPVFSQDNRVFNGPPGCSLCSFATFTRSAALGSAPLRYTRFAQLLTCFALIARFARLLALLTCSIHRLAHSLCSLPRGMVESVFILKLCFTGTIEILVITRNTLNDTSDYSTGSIAQCANGCYLYLNNVASD